METWNGGRGIYPDRRLYRAARWPGTASIGLVVLKHIRTRISRLTFFLFSDGHGDDGAAVMPSCVASSFLAKEQGRSPDKRSVARWTFSSPSRLARPVRCPGQPPKPCGRLVSEISACKGPRLQLWELTGRTGKHQHAPGRESLTIYGVISRSHFHCDRL